MAHIARSNSNIQCPYRLPINAITHDPDCKRKSCLQSMTTPRLTVIAQRAMKTITGYFGGYISKKQKMGNFELRSSVQALPLLHEKLRSRAYKSSSVHLAHMTNRMFTTLEGKGILRMAPEESMLSAMHKASDPLAAEFIRTFRHEYFFGRQLLQRYEQLQNKASHQSVSVLLPKQSSVLLPKQSMKSKNQTDFTSLYGFRPPHADVFFLSPWEFCQWFSAVSLQPPSATNALSKWTESGEKKVKAGNKKECQPIQDYVFDDSKLQIRDGFYKFPPAVQLFKGRPPQSYTRFSSLWCLQKRIYPKVPCPENTPLPNRRVSKETRAKIFSVYLRPWTLARALATEEVPFITDLAETVAGTAQKTGSASSAEDNETPLPSARHAWREYLGKVLPHAERGIRSFMLTCLAEGRAGDDEEDKDRKKGPDIVCQLSLETVHNAVTLRTQSTVSDNQSHTERLVIRTAQQAAHLSQLSVTTGLSESPSLRKDISQLHQVVPTHPSAEPEVENVPRASESTAKMLEEWQPRYASWCERVFVDTSTHTPTPKQRHVLQTIHFRVVQEESATLYCKRSLMPFMWISHSSG